MDRLREKTGKNFSLSMEVKDVNWEAVSYRVSFNYTWKGKRYSYCKHKVYLSKWLFKLYWEIDSFKIDRIIKKLGE